MQIIKLKTYNLYIGDVINELHQFLEEKKYSKILVLCDENTRRFCLPIIDKAIGNYVVIEIPAGEAHKNIETSVFIWQKMLEAQADRKSLCINLGGGVIGDMGGFCASTFKRGMDFIQMPTTLLSQVDASIGGKLGFDFHSVKNCIGVFQNPKAVFIHTDFIETLSKRELHSGYAEVMKHALIANAKQWKQLLNIKDLSKGEWKPYLKDNLMVKKRIVEKDPFEHNVRKALNFGHTVGHAVESLSFDTDNPLLHGEAIGIGMICESYLSYKICGLAKADLERITQYILHIYGKANINYQSFDKLLPLMLQDKKNENALINFTLLSKIGKFEINQNCSADLIQESIAYYKGL